MGKRIICFCGSGKPYRKCCYKQKIWFLKGKEPYSYAIHDSVDPLGPSLVIFSSQEKAARYKDASDEDFTNPAFMRFDFFARDICPGMLRDGITSVSIDLPDYDSGNGMIIYTNGAGGNITAEPFNAPDGFYVFPCNTGKSTDSDRGWFEAEKQSYRIRPPFEDERTYFGHEKFIIIILQIVPGFRFKFACDPEVVDISEFDWTAFREQVIDHVDLEQSTIDLAGKLRVILDYTSRKTLNKVLAALN